MKNNKRFLIFIALTFVIAFVIGFTIAYYSTLNSKDNVFDAGYYGTTVNKSLETNNWNPGDTVSFSVNATNLGSIDSAVRIKVYPEWSKYFYEPESTSGPTSGYDYVNNNYYGIDAAIINYVNLDKWIYNSNDDYYYYYSKIEQGQSTLPLIESVTYNPDIINEFSQNYQCTYTETSSICNIENGAYDDYDFTLNVTIETIQYSAYKEVWNTNIEIN